MSDLSKKVSTLKIVARTTLCAFEIRNDLRGKDPDQDMSILYTRAALVELGFAGCDIFLVMDLLMAAAKAGITPRKEFASGGFATSIESMKPGEYVIAKPKFKKNESPTSDFSKMGDIEQE